MKFLGINKMCQKVNEFTKKMGFGDREHNVGEHLMLITSELGEALDAHRKGRYGVGLTNYILDKGTNKNFDKEKFETHIKDTLEDEVADTAIRLFDFAGRMGIDLEEQMRLKMEYNATRGHKYGKKY